MALGTKLKDILTERGITVKDFANQIGVPPTTLYSFIKRDSEDVKLELITKICNGLGIKVTDFLKTLDYIDGKPATVFDLTNFDENEITKISDKIKNEIDNEPITIAAHFDGEEFTEEEMQKINEFANFVISQRKQHDYIDLFAGTGTLKPGTDVDGAIEDAKKVMSDQKKEK